MSKKSVVGVVGAGYVGLVLAACYAKKGFKIVLCESNLNKFKSLQAGTVPFFEPTLQEIFSQAKQKNQIVLIQNIADFRNYYPSINVIFCCVGTPAKPSGEANLSGLWSVARDLVANQIQGFTLINKSTVPVGTCQKMQTFFDENNLKIEVVHSPEFLRQGSAVQDFFRPDRVVFGTQNNDVETIKLLSNLAKPFCTPEKIIFCDTQTAELSKYAANTMLASRITLMNQLWRFAKKFNANSELIQKIVGMDHRIGPEYLTAGPGFGGSCLPKDLKALIFQGNQEQVNTDFLKSIDKFNNSQIDWYLEQWSQTIGGFAGKEIDFGTITFKENTDDCRSSPKISMLKKMLKHKPKKIFIQAKNISSKIKKALKKHANIILQESISVNI